MLFRSTYKNDSSHTKQYGLIAEDVDSVYPELVLRGQNGIIESIAYQQLHGLMLAGYKQHERTLDAILNRLSVIESALNITS